MSEFASPKIYHIIHRDRLPAVVSNGCLWCDSIVGDKSTAGTTIGMGNIKERRLENPVECRPGLRVGGCVPFYFCPRSVMLFVIHRANDEGLDYKGGQSPIVHLEVDMNETIKWADKNNKRWAFTKTNAGSRYFESYCDISQLSEINWDAVNAKSWTACKEEKQAEFLVEEKFPWKLVERIGVFSEEIYHRVSGDISARRKPAVEIQKEWYY